MCFALSVSWADRLVDCCLKPGNLVRHCTGAFFILAGLLSASVKAEEPAMQTVWKITYRHSYFHLCKAVLSESRAAFTTGIYGFTVLPPDYRKLYVVNPDAQLYLETPEARWYDPNWLRQTSFIKYVRKGDETICGLKCAHYLCLDQQGQTRGEYWTTKSIKARADLTDAFCRICGLPRGLGVPVRYFAVKPGPLCLIKSVEPVSITKDVVNINTFLPRSYKRAQDRYALFVSKSGTMQKSDIEDLFKVHDTKNWR
jgi:hypothetical protein